MLEKITTYFTGGEDLRQANEIIKRLEQQPKLSKKDDLQLNRARVYTRRHILKVGGTAAGLIALGAVSSWTINELFLEENPSIVRLRNTIESLPSSRIKELLQERVLPYYQPDPRSEITYSGVTFKVVPATVKEETETRPEILASGDFTPRRNYPNATALYPLEDTEIEIPILNLLTEEELSEFPQDSKASDSTPLVNISYSTDIPFYQGLAPEITIRTANPKSLPERYQPLIPVFATLARIKEACGHLLFDILLENTVKKMKELNLPTHIGVRGTDNDPFEAEIISQSLQNINHNSGRFLAAYDIAANLLAIKAIKNTSLIAIAHRNVTYAQVIPEIEAINLSDNPDLILNQSLRWAITSVNGQKLHHQGDLFSFP